jgi:hypothetical protein
MIRRLITLMVFTSTVLLAVYGQHLFGRQHLIAWAHKVQTEGPTHAKIAWRQTDRILANLSPRAGNHDGYFAQCTLDDFAWTMQLYQ